MKGVSVIVIYCLLAIFQIFLEQYVVVFNCIAKLLTISPSTLIVRLMSYVVSFIRHII